MKVILFKDLFVSIKRFSVFFIFALFYPVLFILFAETVVNAEVFGVAAIIISALLVILISAYDSKYKWNTYAITMPITRKDLVNSKYVYGIIVSFVAPIIYLIYAVIVGIIYQASMSSILVDIWWDYITVILILSASTAIVLNAIFMPITMKLGAGKSVLIYLTSIFILFIVAPLFLPVFGIYVNGSLGYIWTGIVETLMFFHYTGYANPAFIALPVLVAFAIYAISYRISVKLMKEQDIDGR